MMNKSSARKFRMEERVAEEKKRRFEQEYPVMSADTTAIEDSASSPDHKGQSIPDDDFVTLGVCRNTTQIPTIALEAERYGVSNRAAAAIGTAALVDYGVVSADDKTNVIDRKKICKSRE